ncbi:Uncharacterised protein [Serratia liquefaciens]|nr:Uncharacterised protein [Serratia liquefaciens]
MIYRAKLTAAAALLSLSALAHAAPGLDLIANETPIHTQKDPEAAAKIPAGFKFVEPGDADRSRRDLGQRPTIRSVRARQ